MNDFSRNKVENNVKPSHDAIDAVNASDSELKKPKEQLEFLRRANQQQLENEDSRIKPRTN